jgi:cytoskeletal protein CcmA (bactofilin family)
MPDISASSWDESDPQNNTTPPAGWPEGQMPSTVNDCARMMMGALKRAWNRINPALSAAGSGGAYTYTTANNLFPTAYSQGETFSFKAPFTSVGADTFVVNSLTPLPIYGRTGVGTLTAVGAGDIQAGTMVACAYDSALNSGSGGFQLIEGGGAPINNPSFSGNAAVSGNLSIAGTSTLRGAVAADSTLSVAGNLTMGAGTTLSASNLSAAGTSTLTGPVSTGSNLNVAGTLSVAGALNVNQPSTINALTINGSGTSLNVSAGNANIAGTLTLGQHAVCPDYRTTNGGTTSWYDGNASGFDWSCSSQNGTIVFSNTNYYGPIQCDEAGNMTLRGALIQNSDARIKEVLGDYGQGLPAILALAPRVYRYLGNDTNEKSGPSSHAGAERQFVGLVAQEIEGVFPEMVSRRSGFIDGQAVDDLRLLDPSPLTYALVNAVKELAERLAALEAAR